MAVIVSRLPRKVKADVSKVLGLPVPGKYGNEKVRLDGYVFDSIKEKNRYLVLLMRQKMGEISGLEVHPRFKLIDRSDGQRAVTYVADFSYYTHCEVAGIGGGEFKVEDVKGVKTSVYKLKKRLMKAFLGIDIQEI